MAKRKTTRARQNISKSSVLIRHCRGLEELRACVTLQQKVWNFNDADLVPLRMFVVAEKIGGQVIGAFEGKRLIGFSLSLPAVRDARFYLHSHMLAVDKKHRNLGLGRKLKLFQREDAIARGFDLIEWTFDPLEIKNSYFNIERLGAIARRYTVNQYGISSSPLQGGLPTDRLIGEWWLKSERVEAVLGQRTLERAIEQRIVVPAEIYEWKASARMRSRARKVQEKNKGELLAAFGSGLAVIGYECDEQGNGAFLLGRFKYDVELRA